MYWFFSYTKITHTYTSRELHTIIAKKSLINCYHVPDYKYII